MAAIVGAVRPVLGSWLLVLIGLVSRVGVPRAMRESRRTSHVAL